MEDAVRAIDTDWFEESERKYAGFYWYIGGIEEWSKYPDSGFTFSHE